MPYHILLFVMPNDNQPLLLSLCVIHIARACIQLCYSFVIIIIKPVLVLWKIKIHISNLTNSSAAGKLTFSSPSVQSITLDFLFNFQENFSIPNDYYVQYYNELDVYAANTFQRTVLFKSNEHPTNCFWMFFCRLLENVAIIETGQCLEIEKDIDQTFTKRNLMRTSFAWQWIYDVYNNSNINRRVASWKKWANWTGAIFDCVEYLHEKSIWLDEVHKSGYNWVQT